MIGFSYDIDFYSSWAELVLLGTFNPPDRVYATGTAYLRGQGRGRVRTVHGVEEMQRELGHLVVDAKLPQPGQPASTSYEGEGFVTVRHEDTAVVRAALDRIISGLRVELVEAELTHERRDVVAGLPAGDGVFHPGAGPDRRHGHRGR